jgi:hypothetical protein
MYRISREQYGWHGREGKITAEGKGGNKALRLGGSCLPPGPFGCLVLTTAVASKVDCSW